MAIVKEISRTGSSSTSTLSGSIRLEEARGRLVVYDSKTQTELTVLDNTGFLFSDGTNRRIKLGRYATRVGLWISKDGQDVINLLGG